MPTEISPGLTVETLEDILDQSGPPSLFKAMASAFPDIGGALKDSNNPHFKTKYADLASVVDAIRPAFAKNGLFFYQRTYEQSGGVCVETFVGHSSGEQMSFGRLYVPSSKQDAQGYGSALTYARRYSLMTAFGVCPEDDDGNAAAAAPRDVVKVITPAQETELQDLAKEVGADLPAFLKWCGVTSLASIPAQNYMDARNALERKRPKAKGNDLDDEVPHYG